MKKRVKTIDLIKKTAYNVRIKTIRRHISLGCFEVFFTAEIIPVEPDKVMLVWN